MTRNRRRSRKPKAAALAGPRLAHELFSELNATFYEDDPSEYLLTKIEAVTLMLAPAEALAPAYASERVVGVSRRAGAPVPSKEARDRYVRTECVLVLHHACEMLLRLFFAHVDKQDCPWLGMAASVSFAEFKEKVSTALRTGFDRDDVARVFLGGTNPGDAALAVDVDEFDDTTAAWQVLLETAADCRTRTSGTPRPPTTARRRGLLLYRYGSRIRGSSARPPGSCSRSRRTGRRACDPRARRGHRDGHVTDRPRPRCLAATAQKAVGRLGGATNPAARLTEAVGVRLPRMPANSALLL